MTTGRRALALSVILLGLVVLSQLALAGKKDKPGQASFPMDEQKRAVHALNRLSFGPRPGDLQRVMAVGVDKWIDEQLHPEKIDDAALEARLTPLRTLRMNTRELFENFPSAQMIKSVADGKRGLPSDPARRAIYEAQLDRYEDKLERKQESSAISEPPSDSATGSNKTSNEERSRDQEGQMLANARVREFLDMPPDQRFHSTLQMSAREQQTLLASLHGKRDEFLEGMTPQQRETIVALRNPRQVVLDELAQGKLLRATYSERQLQGS